MRLTVETRRRAAHDATGDLTLTRHAEPLRFESVPLATRSYR